MLSIMLPPGLILIFGALLLALVPTNVRRVLVVVLPLLVLAAVWLVAPPVHNIVHLVGIDLRPYHVHPFSPIFGTAFAIAALAGGIFGLKTASRIEVVASFFYAGSALGIVFAGDLVTMFVFWEMIAVGSTIIIWCGGREGSAKAGMRYAYMHIFGGVLLLSGLMAHIISGGGLSFAPFDVSLTGGIDLKKFAAILVLLGVLVNAAAPPFSAWLADSYPESSPSGMVFLSAFTTKAAVFVLLTLFAGNKVLIPIGLFMVFYGIFYAMLENDARRILAYSIVNQVGFMVTGAGIGTEIAQLGTASHAFCHIIYKALLIMSAGSVLNATGKTKCTELGGLYRTMPLTTFCGIVGALSISAFPLTSGFVSKSLISVAASEQYLGLTWFLLAAASAGVFLHAGIKYPWFVFFQKDSKLRPAEAPIEMRVAMLLLVAGCLIPGLMPEWLYAMLPGGYVNYVPYTAGHIVTQLQLLLFSGLAFFLLLPMMQRTNTISLDFDWLYRVLLRRALLAAEVGFYKAIGGVKFAGQVAWHYVQSLAYEVAGPRRALAGNWGVGLTTLLMAALLVIFLILSYR